MSAATSFAAKRVLITGANGFIGARLASRLAREGANVRGLVSPGSRAEHLPSEVIVERADIRDPDAVNAVVTQVAPQLIYHLASYGNHPAHYSGGIQDTITRISEINVLGTANLLGALAEVDFECLVNTGSAFAEYGPATQPMRETQRLAPDSYYGAAKAGATLLVSAFGARQRKNVVTLRPLYVYGPGEWELRFIPTVIARCLRGETLSLTSLSEKKNFVFIDDVVEAYLLAPRAGRPEAPIFNIGAESESTLGDVIRIVERCLGQDVTYVENAYTELQWPGECWAADIDLAAQVLGWRPSTTLEEGVQRTLEWMRETGRVS